MWTRPGHPTFQRVIADCPHPTGTFHDGVNLRGDATWQVVSSYTRFADILHIDHQTPANCNWSVIRYFAESDPTTPFFEWLPTSIVPASSKEDPTVQVSGQGIKSILGFGRVEAWDWDGSPSFVSTFPDWIYGGPNVLQNPGIETNSVAGTIYLLDTEASAGTFTLSDGTDTTGAIAYNVSPSTLETTIQTDITAINDVLVSGSGVPTDPWHIEFVDPPLGITLTVNGGGLTPAGSANLVLEREGALVPNPWTKSQQISFGVPKEFGTYASDGFRVSEGAEPVLTGNYSLRVNGLSQFAGAQQVVNVTPGGIYQVVVPMWTSSGTDLFRLVVRDINEGFIDSFTGGLGAATTANVSDWDTTTFTIVDLRIPDGVTQVIFRFAYVGTGNPAPFYLDDLQMNEGLATTTIGAILLDQYDDMTVDHVGAGRLVWEDEANPGTCYLIPTFTDALDSNGDAWADPELQMRIWMRMTLVQVMDQAVGSWEYEWNITPLDVANGTWNWNVYNPNGMGVDTTPSPGPAIQGGSSTVTRSIQRYLPRGSDFLVEGLERLTARVSNAGLVSSLGYMETGRLDNELTTLTGAGQAAAADSSQATALGVTYVYEVVNPASTPLAEYQLGDLLIVHDPPEVIDVGRFIDCQVVVSPNETVWEVTFIPEAAL